MEKRRVTEVPSTRYSGVAVQVEPDEGQEHEDAAGQGVEEELDGRVLPPRPAPDADEEVHRQEHDLPEHVEEEEVEGDEDAEHARDQEGVHGEVALELVVDAVARQGSHEGDERGQEDHRDGDPVDAEEVLDVERADPDCVLDELVAVVAVGAREAGVELRGEPGGQDQAHPHHDDGEEAEVLVLLVADQVGDEDRDDHQQRQEGDDREDVLADEAEAVAALAVDADGGRAPGLGAALDRVGLDEHVAVELAGLGHARRPLDGGGRLALAGLDDDRLAAALDLHVHARGRPRVGGRGAHGDARHVERALARVLDDEGPRHLGVVSASSIGLVDVAARAVDVDPAVGDLGGGGAAAWPRAPRASAGSGPGRSRASSEPEDEPQGQQEGAEELHRRTLENVDHRVSQRRKYWTMAKKATPPRRP